MISPPVNGFLHPVVPGKDIGSLKIDLKARKANACASTKSPSIPYSSIGWMKIFFTVLFLIFSIKR